MTKGKKDMIIRNVKTKNFPYELIDGEEHYPLHSAAVVESIADQIPDEVKPLIAIDYDAIPDSYFQKVKAELGIKPVNMNRADEHERKLLESLEQAGVFKQ
ncbi:hypothetical protein [Paenibacillus senegalimassiliensis]|uniref:hypothetical protein n=1 Tax=Paenibacillus senegalimassiliensis TaxID=1737426 RepID=UPI0011DDCEF8|nr:hypothetical protein [Paenibacillus senegalimassiliensis]